MKPDQTHPDTAAGAETCFREMADILQFNMTNIKVSPDPAVVGVWKIEFPNDKDIEFSVVWMAGYPRAGGGPTRIYSDFECQYRD